jgi:hypothetical protein
MVTTLSNLASFSISAKSPAVGLQVYAPPRFDFHVCLRTSVMAYAVELMGNRKAHDNADDVDSARCALSMKRMESI